MSTYIYLVCEDHEPPLLAEGESGQHVYDLPDIRRDLANRDLLVAAAAEGAEINDYFRRNTLRFLLLHPACRIGIADEYGCRYDPQSAGLTPLTTASTKENP